MCVLCVYAHAHVHARMHMNRDIKEPHAPAQMWPSKNILQELVLSFRHVDPGEQTQPIRFAGVTLTTEPPNSSAENLYAISAIVHSCGY